MANWLVLGLGNPLAGADAFGPLVVERLHAGSPISGVSIADAGTDLLDWISRFGEYDHVVLVDAVAVDEGAAAPAPTPCVAVVAEQIFAGWDGGSPGVHEISPLVSLRLFRTLQRANETIDVPSIHLVSLFVTETEFGTCPADAHVCAGVAAVRRLVERAKQASYSAGSGSHPT